MPLKTVKCGQYSLVGSAWSVVQWPWTALVRKWNQAGGMQIQYGPASHAGPYASNWSAVSWFMWDYDRSQYEGPGTDGPHTSIQSPFWKKKFTLSLSNSLSMLWFALVGVSTQSLGPWKVKSQEIQKTGQRETPLLCVENTALKLQSEEISYKQMEIMIGWRSKTKL